MLKIWGRANSSNVQKVLWGAEELGLPFERIDIGGPFGGTKEPQYLALNPNSLVPTIEDDGLVLWESNSILRYLAGQYGNAKAETVTLLPTIPAKRAEAERWMDWQLTTLTPSMTTLFGGLVRTPPEKRDLTAIEAARKSAANAFDILDRHLAARDFVAGMHFTVGDIPIGIAAWRWFNLPIERPSQPHLRAWFERLLERPGYKKYVALPMT
ncbi:MAG TPA: glutathione S-transferase [Magnetospirillaceae bacterium]|jgi:glutathione S-transferase